ncbi:hypothetical protein LOTGIDRAFT_214791 [Lottia gigantea]|uniref:Endothelin-converting enzyme 1 n=1 Tax=Lottia gigantea TaxID=225164 RepID=V4APW2_LOTGI|nr:hypothetical protein LOTGIDRAFT_214791 [Lottia gigantea]ESO95681.1 hypothetical protein LOTGIDRAFT_214791 [Lottia gigantea]
MAKWTGREKGMMFLTVVFLIVAAALAVVLALKYQEDDDPSEETKVNLVTEFQVGIKEGSTGHTDGASSHILHTLTTRSIHQDDVCMTPECVKTSADLLDAMDQSIDPCEDFFQYSCGKWNQKHVIPEDKSGLSRFNEVRDDVKAKLKGVIEKDDASDIDAIKKTKIFYQSCMNESSIAMNSKPELDQAINELGGWPLLLPNWNETGFNLEKLLADYLLVGGNGLIRTSVQPDDKDTSEYVILLDQGLLFMVSRSYYLNGRDDVHVQAYEKYVVEVAKKFGAKSPESDVRDVIDFEIQMANLTTPASERRDTNKLYHKIAIKSLNVDSNGFNWIKYLFLAFKNFYNSMSVEEEIVVYEPGYLKNVIELVNNTPKKTVANYIMMRFVLSNIQYLSEEFRILKHDYNKVMSGAKHDSARWGTCLDHTLHMFPVSGGRMFVDKYFDEEAKKEAKVLITNIRQSFSEIINETTWMDQETKDKAEEKVVSALRERIAYPEWIKDNDELDKFLAEVNVSDSHLFRNVLDKTKHNVATNLKKIKESVDKTKWYQSAAIVNAFYDPSTNSITFPAGILQPPFYNEHYPRSLIYGGIGLVIGHEITHGFDDQGSRQYDKDGNLKSWWTNSSSDNFNDLAQCIIDQYSKFTIGNDHIKGKNTQGENIADNGGIHVAFRAYHKWLENHSEDFKQLPGVELKHDQLFFLNFAQGWCGLRTPAAQHNQILSDPHSPGRFRIIGTLSNSEEFSKAYQCKPGSRMNPEHKCRVW